MANLNVLFLSMVHYVWQGWPTCLRLGSTRKFLANSGSTRKFLAKSTSR